MADKVDAIAITIGLYEREEVNFSIEVAAKIAAALGVSLDYLTGLSDNQVDAAMLNKIIEIQSLAEADRRHIMTTIDALLSEPMLVRLTLKMKQGNLLAALLKRYFIIRITNCSDTLP